MGLSKEGIYYASKLQKMIDNNDKNMIKQLRKEMDQELEPEMIEEVNCFLNKVDKILIGS